MSDRSSSDKVGIFVNNAHVHNTGKQPFTVHIEKLGINKGRLSLIKYIYPCAWKYRNGHDWTGMDPFMNMNRHFMTEMDLSDPVLEPEWTWTD